MMSITPKTTFTQATRAHYWHYVLAKRTRPETYAKPEIAQKISELGPNALRQQASHGWTPTHVAVLCGNAAGLRFLKTQNALDLTTPDEQGKTALDYARDQPDLHVLLTDNCPHWEVSTIRLQELQSLLPTPVSLPSHSFCYHRATNDFGVEIRELLFAKAHKSNIATNALVQDMRRVAHQERFALVETNTCYWPRDHLFRIGGKVYLNYAAADEIKDSKNLIRSIYNRAFSQACYFQQTAAFRTLHPFFTPVRVHKNPVQAGGASIVQFYDAAQDLARRTGQTNTPTSRVFSEGGNLFFTTNAKGVKKLFVGKPDLQVNHLAFREIELFDDSKITFPTLDPTDRDEQQALEEMFSMGLLPQDQKSGLLTLPNIRKLYERAVKERSLNFKNAAIEMGMIPKFRVTQAKTIAARYLAEQQLVVDIFAHIYQLPSSNVHGIEAAAYHLDFFMHPGPKGSMFVQDFSLCLQVLEQIQAHAERFHLTSRDLELLERYRQAATGLQNDLGGTLAEVNQQLRSADFIVIPTPGLFFDTAEHHREYVCFMNAITGYSETNNSYFYITTGAQLGDRLGAALMDMFGAFLHQYQQGIHLHYVGRNPQDSSNFSPAMHILTTTNSGVHCMSFENEVETHIDDRKEGKQRLN